jgi:putative hydrolases of HD superfamily
LLAGQLRGQDVQEQGKSESSCHDVHDRADKLECLIQAREYQSQGYQLMQPWVDTMLAAVRTPSGQRLAEAAAQMPVDAWWHDIVASYGYGQSPTK